MKIRRFCSLFFALLLTLSLVSPALAAEEDGPFQVEAKAALLIDPDTAAPRQSDQGHDLPAGAGGR